MLTLRAAFLISLDVDKLDEENLGEMIYFFEKACAISGYMLGVNPFNQPGVESYKKNMFALLGSRAMSHRRLNSRLSWANILKAEQKEILSVSPSGVCS